MWWYGSKSLIRFAQAADALRLDNGRCASQNLNACGSCYYDPHGMYADPTHEVRLKYAVARFNFQIWGLGRGRLRPIALTPVPE